MSHLEKTTQRTVSGSPSDLDLPSVKMYILVSETTGYCDDCESLCIHGFTKSEHLALNHILSGLHVGRVNHMTPPIVPRIIPSSTHYCVCVDDTDHSLSSLVSPADHRLDIGIFEETSDDKLREAATSSESTAAVTAYIAERDRILDLKRTEVAWHQAKQQEADVRQVFGVQLLTFPNFLTLLSGGPPGASHKRIPPGDLCILVNNIHTMVNLGVLIDTRFCMKVNQARYEVELAQYKKVPTCVCDACVRANRTEFAKENGRCIPWYD